MRNNTRAFALALALIGAMTLAPLAVTAANYNPTPAAPSSGLTIPINTSLANGAGGTFAGTLTINKFVTRNGQLSAVGTLAGTVTNAAGAILGSVVQTVTLPVTATGSCDILHLELGP